MHSKRLQHLAQLLQQQNAVLVAHYYTAPEIQDLALMTQGCVGDSLEMARFGHDHPAPNVVVAGVRFMGETAKILSPEKTIRVIDNDATCSLDLSCPADEFTAFCDAHPDREVVVYANTSAAVKARADWVITSSIALDVIHSLKAQGKKILWAPDKHLGAWIQAQTGADMLLWDGACVVHEEFKAKELASLKAAHPQAIVLVHPESPAEVIALADVVGSTTQLIRAAANNAASTFIVATDQGILHAMQAQAPYKTFIAAPTAGDSGTCKSCAFCPWMGMNSLDQLEQMLTQPAEQTAIEVAEHIRTNANKALGKMLDFAQNMNKPVQTTGDMEQDQPLFAHVGMA